MLRLHRLAVPLLAVALVACHEAPPPEPTVDDATIKQRVVDYYQKTVMQPGLVFTVTKLEDADVPGFRKGTLQLTLGQQHQENVFHVSRDGRFLLRGDVVDLTLDPAAAARAKLRLTDVPSRGPADAAVVIVEFADFECPFCSRVYGTVETQVLKAYGDKVRFVFKNFPLTAIHPWAEDAAIAARCAFQQSNAGFWKLYDGFFTKQGEITREHFAETATALATAAGLDGSRFGSCLSTKATLDAVKVDQEEATSLGVNSTPTFFVNGRRLTGAQTFESFKQTIDEALGATR